jgi:4-amino-4-deoxy-L-arabinose transferase-like glycosyltransferase
VLALALAVRVLWVVHTWDFVPTHDAHDFDRYAVSIARFDRLPIVHHGVQRGPLAYRPPGYPLFLAAVYKVFGLGDHVVAARLVQAFTGTLGVGLIAAIGWLLWGPAVGIVAGLIAAVYPPFVFVTESMYSEALFLPVSLGALAAALMFRRSGRLRWAALTGLLCGYGVLVRPNSALLLVPLALLLWGVARPRLSRRALAAPALAAVCALLVVAPWTVRNAVVMHHFVPVTTELGNTMAGTYNDESRLAPDRPAAWTEPRFTPEYSSYFWTPGMSDVRLDEKLQSLAFHYIERHPSYLWEVLRWNTVRLLDLAGFAESHIGGDTIGIGPNAADLGTVSFWVLGLVALGGILTAGARRAPRALWVLPAAWYLSVIFLNAEAPRFRVGMDPYFVLLAALGSCAVAQAVAQARRRRARPSGWGASLPTT